MTFVHLGTSGGGFALTETKMPCAPKTVSHQVPLNPSDTHNSSGVSILSLNQDFPPKICRSYVPFFPFFFVSENYDDLYHWSVESYSDFWAEFWKFSGIVFSRTYDEVSRDFAYTLSFRGSDPK